MDLDSGWEGLVADISSSNDGQITEGDGDGGDIVGDNVGECAKHVAHLLEAVGGDISIDQRCITEDVLIVVSQFKLATYRILVWILAVANANLPVSGEVFWIVERIFG